MTMIAPRAACQRKPTGARSNSTGGDPKPAGQRVGLVKRSSADELQNLGTIHLTQVVGDQLKTFAVGTHEIDGRAVFKRNLNAGSIQLAAEMGPAVG